MIKPIETRYKGCWFRSRTEARWAVFFDSMGEPSQESFPPIKWQYEVNGFKLSDGTSYLPDFLLTDLDCWVEVKGKEATQEERSKCERLGWDTGKPVILLVGTPGDTQPEIYCSDLTDSSGGEGWHKCRFGHSMNRIPCIEILDCNNPNREFMGPGFQDACPLIFTNNSAQYGDGLEYCGEPNDNYQNPFSATNLARSVRFEDGEARFF